MTDIKVRWVETECPTEEKRYGSDDHGKEYICQKLQYLSEQDGWVDVPGYYGIKIEADYLIK